MSDEQTDSVEHFVALKHTGLVSLMQGSTFPCILCCLLIAQFSELPPGQKTTPLFLYSKVTSVCLIYSLLNK